MQMTAKLKCQDFGIYLLRAVDNRVVLWKVIMLEETLDKVCRQYKYQEYSK